MALDDAAGKIRWTQIRRGEAVFETSLDGPIRRADWRNELPIMVSISLFHFARFGKCRAWFDGFLPTLK